MRLMGSNMVTIDIAELARSMKSLGDPTRLEMLCCIKNQSTYGQELSNRFGVTSTTVYHHMNKLLMGRPGRKQAGGKPGIFLHEPPGGIRID